MAKVMVKGGPADGVSVAPDSRLFVWIEMVPVKRDRPCEAGGLYERRGDVYEFIGSSSVCECGAVFRRAEGAAERQNCPLCGGGS